MMLTTPRLALLPKSCAMAIANAVFPVPGGPAKSTARPAIRLDLIKSTTSPAAYIVQQKGYNPISIE